MFDEHQPIINSVSEEFARHAVIQPPAMKARDVETRAVRVLVDSRDRDRAKYPSASSYSVEVPEHVRDVISVELISYDVPFNDYNITERNNVLHTAYMQEGETDYESPERIVLPPGRYTPEQLADALNNGTDYDTHPLNKDHFVDFNHDMDRVDPKFMDVVASRPHHIPIAFWYDNKTLKMYIRFECFESAQGGGVVHRGKVKLMFGESNSIGPTLGYKAEDMHVYHSPNAYIPPLIPNHPVNLRQDNYIALYLEAAKRLMSTNHKTHQAFATIRRNNDENGAYVLSSSVRKRFPAALPALKQIKLSFKTHDGSLYDFQNKEHTLELVYVCYKQTRDYGMIFSE